MLLKNLSDRFFKMAKGWLILILLIIDLFFAGFLFPLIQGMLQDKTGAVQPLDLMIFATPDKIFAMIERYGEPNRVFYRNVELTVDILYPIVYLFFFGLLISWLFEYGFPSNHPMRKLNTLPFGLWVSDLFENLCIATLLSIHPSQPKGIAWLLVSLTSIKWLFAGASILLILVGFVMAIKNGFKKL